jgi:hypothetical protein
MAAGRCAEVGAVELAHPSLRCERAEPDGGPVGADCVVGRPGRLYGIAHSASSVHVPTFRYSRAYGNAIVRGPVRHSQVVGRLPDNRHLCR